MGYTNVQADVNFYRQSLNADGIKDVTGPYTSLYEDVFRAITVTTDSVVSVTSYVGDSLSNQFLFAGTEIYGLFSSVTIHSGNAILHLAGASYISEIVNQYSASGIPLGFYEEGTQCLSQKISALLTQGVFDDASWVMVPSQYEEDWVRAFKPTSTLGDLAFTRSSDATFTDSTGVVRRSPWNLLTFSEMFSDASWTKVRSTITANTVNAPNGTLTADTITCTETSTDGCFVRQSVSLANERTTSIYVKPNTAEYFQIHRDFGSGVVFNLTNGTVKQSVGATGTITAQADGWYRCTATFSASGLSLFLVGNSSMTVATWFSTINQSLYLWGAQLVEGTEALPYFATTDRLNVPRLDYSNADGTLSTCPRLLLEPQRTNSIRNSSMVAAVAGSPGTLPTNWSQFGSSGLTRTISIGTENGLPYVDLRYVGTSTDGFIEIRYELTNGAAALPSQIWNGTTYIRCIGASLSSQQNISARSAALASLQTFTTGFTTTGALTRYGVTTTATPANTAFVQPANIFFLTIGTAYDFTIRIAAPQMELGAYATTWVPTTTAAVTRIAERSKKTSVSSLIGQTEGTLFIDCDYPREAATTVVRKLFTINSGTFANIVDFFIPTGLNSFTARFRANGAGYATITTASMPLGRTKIAFGYKAANCSLYINGTLIGSVTTGGSITVSPPISIIGVGIGEGPDGDEINGGINQAALFPVRLDNATLAALTTL